MANKTTRPVGLKNSIYKSDPLVICHNLLQRKVGFLKKDFLQAASRKSADPKGNHTCEYSGLELPKGKHPLFELQQYIKNVEKVGDLYVFKQGKACTYLVQSMPKFIINNSNKNIGSILPIDPEILAILSADETCIELVGKGYFTFTKNSEELLKLGEYSDYYRFSNPLREFSDFLTLEDQYSYGIKSPSFRTTYGFRYTFGVEVECASSYVPDYIISAFNMLCTRDGSLNGGKGGPEYVTGVLTGDSGMMHLQQIFNYISGRSTIDRYCGNHVHIGGFKPTKEFAVALFMLCYYIQDEVFLLLPISRRTNEYCRKIPASVCLFLQSILNQEKVGGINNNIIIEQAYDYLVEYVAALDQLGGKEAFIQSKGVKKEPLGKYLNKNAQHPLGKKCNYNHKTPRYEWLNMVPFLFNEKGKDVYTVEFRPHSASLNFSKMRYWVNLCMAIVNFAENNASKILFSETKSITLEQIVHSTIKSSISVHSITKYLEERKAKFSDGPLKETASKKENILYEEESFANYEDQTLKELCA